MIKVNIVRHHAFFVDVVKTLHLPDEASARRWAKDILIDLEQTTYTEYRAMLYECENEQSESVRFIGEVTK